MAWILLRPSNYKQVAPLVRTGGSRHTGLAALPHRNIHEDEGSAVAEGILDRIINNKYSIEVKGRISMRKRHAFSDEGNGVNDNG